MLLSESDIKIANRTPFKVFQSFFQDIENGLKAWRVWTTLGWLDIKQRYRRSVLGPLWITLSMSVMVYSLGLIYGSLFNMDLKKYFPFLSAGMIIWTFISSTILETVDAFVEAGSHIKQIKLPFSVYIIRIIYRNLIVFFHNLVVFFPIAIYFQISFKLIPFTLTLLLSGAILFFLGMILAII